MLVAIRGRQAKLPQDMVYSVLGLCADDVGGVPLIKPDYTKSMREVYIEVWRSCIKVSGELGMLELVEHTARDVATNFDGLPSWGLRNDQPTDWITELPLAFSAPTRASDGRLALFENSSSTEDKGVLAAKGIRIDAVYRLSKIFPPRWKFRAKTVYYANAVMEEIAHLLSRIPALVKSETGLELELAIADTMCAGNNMPANRLEDNALEGFEALKRCATDGLVVPEIEAVERDTMSAAILRASEFAYSTTIACGSRRFFITATGRVGLCPQVTHGDDVVAVLYGMNSPVVLRPVGDHFLYLGTAYVHGIMQGEAIAEHEKNGNADMLFKIC